MCTVVCRWRPGGSFPVQVLALRDELASRSFDPPDAWWPDRPRVIGGRDHAAGGSWCVSDVVDGVTAAVLNRPERPDAAAGAPSRGVLPLLAAQYRDHWPEHVDLTAMASFNLVLAAPEALVWWRFDGRRLDRQDLTAGTFLFTPRSLRIEGLDPRFAAGEARLGENLAAPAERVWPEWLAVLAESVPSDDPSSLIVHLPRGKDIYETVFGQLIAARPGVLRLDYLIRPALGTDRRWTTELWRADRLDEATVSRDSQADVRPSRTIRSHPESVST